MGGKETWAFIFLLGAVIFNWPLMSIFGGTLAYVLYGAWAILIICIWALDVLDIGQDNS